jgi:hypothetical protein
MRPVSAAFLDAVTGSHSISVRLQVVPAGQTGVEPAGGVELYVIDGDVRQDGRADIRASLDCEVAAADPVTGELFWPDATTSPLTPYGAHELFVERGVAFGGGGIEYVSLGYFRIDDVEQRSAPDGPISIVGSDRMSMIIDSGLTTPWQFYPTDTYAYVVEQLVTDAYLDAVIEWDEVATADAPIGRGAIVERDRYAFLRELITGAGKVFYFDHRGVLVIRTPPDPSAPVWTAARGPGGVLVSASRSLSREGVYNGVLATGEALDEAPPSRGLAVDDDPDSPTYWYGPFGRISREFSSPLMTTDAQCVLAATTILRRSTGLPYSVELSAVPNPALEPDDPIAIGFEGAPEVITPTLLVGDSFSRTVVNGIGTSESGHPWSVAAGTDAACQVTGGVMTRTSAANTANVAVFGATPGVRDVDIAVDVRAPSGATGTEALVLGVVTRYAASDHFLASRFEHNANGTLTLKIVTHRPDPESDGEQASLVDFAPYVAGDWWTVRTRVRGDVVELKAWPRDEAEPLEWQLSWDGANIIDGTANRFGLYFWRLTGNTSPGPQWEIDNWRAYSAPRELLRGGELHVIDTLTVPLTAAGAMRGTTRQQNLVSIGVLDQ